MIENEVIEVPLMKTLFICRFIGGHRHTDILQRLNHLGFIGAKMCLPRIATVVLQRGYELIGRAIDIVQSTGHCARHTAWDFGVEPAQSNGYVWWG